MRAAPTLALVAVIAMAGCSEGSLSSKRDALLEIPPATHLADIEPIVRQQLMQRQLLLERLLAEETSNDQGEA